ncbi:hypothetical protein H311_01404, partial [Anncaliia algerae PRA109]
MAKKEDVYNVEEILDSRDYMGKKQYYIKWEGYDHEHNTWEYAKDVFCKDLIQQFENKKKNKKVEKKAPTPSKRKPIKKEVVSETEYEIKDINDKIKLVKSVYQKEGLLFFQVEYLDGSTGV